MHEWQAAFLGRRRLPRAITGKKSARRTALVQLGQLLRTVFLADYFVNDAFRRELLRVLNRGESVNALKRAIYTGRVASFQAKRHDELRA